jgi:hypothetical protein
MKHVEIYVFAISLCVCVLKSYRRQEICRAFFFVHSLVVPKLPTTLAVYLHPFQIISRFDFFDTSNLLCL